MMLLQGREGDSPAADQVPGRQAWAGGRIRGTVCQFIPFLEALLTIRVCYFFLLACVDGLVSMHLYFSPLFFSLGAFFSMFYAPPFFFLSFFFTLHRACFLAFPTSVMKGTRELEKGIVVPYRCGTTHTYIQVYILSAFTYI